METEIYTMEQWNRDGVLKPTRGQIMAQEVIDRQLNDVPPLTWRQGVDGLFQVGEPHDNDPRFINLYTTYVCDGVNWRFVGYCYPNTTIDPYALYIKNNGVLSRFYLYDGKTYCGLYAAVGYNEGERAGDLFAVATGPALVPVYNQNGNRARVSPSLAGMSFNPRNGWHKE